MRFSSARLKDAFIIDLEIHSDSRGFFARTYCAREFAAHGLPACFVQCNTSCSRERGTLRGLHYQAPPDTEAKLVRCTRGSILDVIVDLRLESPTYGEHLAVELTAAGGRSLYVPPGFAHGFQTLEDNVEVFYQMTNFHAPESAAGLRYDDPQLSISWPLPVTQISEKDLHWPFLSQWGNPFVGLAMTERVDEL